MRNIMTHIFSFADLAVAEINDGWLPLITHAKIGKTYVSMDYTSLVD